MQRRENDEKTFDKGVVCTMLHDDAVSLSTMNLCELIEEGLTNVGKCFFANNVR